MKKFTLGAVLLTAMLLVLAACGGADSSTTAPALEEIDLSTLPATVDVQTVATVRDNPDVYMLDVREQWEYDEGHIPGITLIPMGDIPARLDDIPTDKQVIVTCRTGNRSSQVADYLRQQGFDNIHNMDGGIVAWEAAGLPVE